MLPCRDTVCHFLRRCGPAIPALHVHNALSGWQIPATPRLARRNSAQVLIYCGSFFAIPRLVIAHNRSNYERVKRAAGRAETCHHGPNSPSARTLLCSLKVGIYVAIASSIKSRAREDALEARPQGSPAL